MATRSPTSSPKGDNQHTFKFTDKNTVLIWRRILMIRYFNKLGADKNCNITWKDFDIKNRPITLSDEKHPFEWRMPPNLMKSSVEIVINKEKLGVISIFYTTNSMMIQGKNSQKWMTYEHDLLKELVTKISRGKGRNSSSEVDKLIKNVKFPTEICEQSDMLENSEINDSSLLEALESNDNESTETPKRKKSDENTIHEDKPKNIQHVQNNNLASQVEKIIHEIQAIKETMHSVELKIVEKNDLINETKTICEKLVEKCEKIPEIQKEVTKIKEVIVKINQSENSKEIVHRTKTIENQTKENSIQIKQISNTTNEIKEDLTNVKEDFLLTQNKVHTANDKKVTDHTKPESVDKQENKQMEETTKPIDNQKKADVWIVGSSIVKDLDGRKVYQNRNTRITTLRDKSIRGAKEYIKSKKINSDNIVLQIGSNDLDNVNPEVGEVFEEYENLITTTAKEYPSAKLFVGEILPRYYESQQHTRQYDTKRRQFNFLLKDMCEDKNIELIKHDNFEPFDFYDGVHLQPVGIQNFVRNFKKIVNPHVNISYTPSNNNCRPSPSNQNYYDGRGKNNNSYGNSFNPSYHKQRQMHQMSPPRDERRNWHGNNFEHPTARYPQNPPFNNNQYNRNQRMGPENIYQILEFILHNNK